MSKEKNKKEFKEGAKDIEPKTKDERKIDIKFYEKELAKLHARLVKKYDAGCSGFVCDEIIA